MKPLKTTILLVFTLLLGSCQDDDTNPNYPVEPFITLEAVEFIDSEYIPSDLPVVFDSLIVVISYRDGDSDLRSKQNHNPQDPYTYLPNPQTGEKYWLYNEKDAALPSFNCRDYTLIEAYDNSHYQDTVRADYNTDYYNFRVTIWKKRNGVYEEIDFVSSCDYFPLGGIFRMEDTGKGTAFTAHPNSQWEGRITYVAYGFFSNLKNDSIKVGVSIRDEALHWSNTVVSEPFLIR